MRKINPIINGKQYKQISKPAARKLFIAGKEIFLNPSKLMPGGPWVTLCPVKLDPDLVQMKKDLYADFKKSNIEVTQQFGDTERKQFEETVRNFETYNCTAETGTYANFYTEQ